VSREALSLDISRLVSRVVRGESIDIAERGAALAAQYPDLGMSGALIGQAIERAAGMVGMIRDAPEPPRLPRSLVEAVTPSRTPAVNGEAVRPVQMPRAPGIVVQATIPVAAQSIDDELAAAIDAEIGNLVSDHAARPSPNTNGGTHASDGAEERAGQEMPMQFVHPPVSVEVPAPTEIWPNGEAHLAANLEHTQRAGREPVGGSIFSSFRRALFRT
jgi:hypothetical protein